LYSGIDFKLAGSPGARLPVNIFDNHSGRMKLDNPRIEAFGLNRSRIILSGSSLPNMCLPSFDYVPRLRIPEQTHLGNESKLLKLGLDSDRWFACFYWREPGYLQRSRQAKRADGGLVDQHTQRWIAFPIPAIDTLQFPKASWGWPKLHT
jgi:hypothetical protein